MSTPHDSTKSPIRVQRQRSAGWRMPANTVYVGRPTIFGNPWKVGEPRDQRQPNGKLVTAQEAVDMYRFSMCAVDGRPGIYTNFEGSERDLNPLRGKNLACWCALDQPCHADVLLELANAEGR